jgi:hypothetical protein
MKQAPHDQVTLGKEHIQKAMQSNRLYVATETRQSHLEIQCIPQYKDTPTI